MQDKAQDAGFSFQLDHWGSTRLLDGTVAFVHEPYDELDHLAPAMEFIAGELNCQWFVSGNSWWFPTKTIRGGLYQ